MNRILFVFLILFTATSCAKEIDGWDKTTWGMTIEQAKNLYSDSSEYVTSEGGNNVVGLRVKNQALYNLPVISFLKFENNKLTSVRLVHLYNGKEFLHPTHAERTPEYKEFQSSLESDYGSPDFINELEDFGWYELGWYAGSTMVKLTHKPDSVFIDYFERLKK